METALSVPKTPPTTDHHLLDSHFFKPFSSEASLSSRVLVYDQDEDSLEMISRFLANTSISEERRFETCYCRQLSQVSDYLSSSGQTDGVRVELLIWGLEAPFEEGLRALQDLRAIYPEMAVILLAKPEALAHASAIKSIHVEAFILKPAQDSELQAGIERALSRKKKTEISLSSLIVSNSEVTALSDSQESISDNGAHDLGHDLGLIGASSEMKRIRSLIRKIGPTGVSVMITGESGTGKEMVASAIHQVSDRRDKPFVAINCAAIPKELLESELFGHAKGAFTGATSARRGLFEEAHHGTILLDEIGDLSLPLQAKILRLIQTRQVKPLGQNSVREVDVRIISATHKSLKSLIQRGEFREDLYYRLNVMPIHLPPLREREEDIILLAEFFLKKFSAKKQRRAPELSRKACSKLLSLPWKGNVRELENVIERAIVLSDGRSITDEEIVGEELETVRISTEDLFSAGMSLKDIEREYIRYVLSRTGNRKEAATRILGIDRKTLYRKEKIYGIRQSLEMN